MVDLDRGEPQAREAGRGAGGAHEARQVEPGRAVAVAAEVDPGQDDLAVALRDAALDLGEHALGRRLRDAPRTCGNDAERAREAAAVLHLHEGADPVEPDVGPHAADRADVAGDELGRALARERDDA